MVIESKSHCGGWKEEPDKPRPKPALKERCESLKIRTRVSSTINFKEYEPWLRKSNYTAHHTNGEGFVNYTDAEVFCERLPNIHVFMHDSGMIATHNMPCPICKTNHAVFVSSEGHFDACRKCRSEGWYVGRREVVKGKPKKWWEFWK